MKRILLGAALLAAATLGPAHLAYGYTTNGCRWPGTTVWYSNVAYTTAVNGVTSYYWSRGQEAVNSWNNASLDASWSAGTANVVTIYNTNRGNDGRVGLSTWSCPGGNFANPTSSWNEYYTWSYTASYQRAIMIHELGHTVGLGHATSCYTIMWSAVTACGVYTIQLDDKQGVNSIY